ncbi:class I SAM-dependent methyltransferase [Nitrosopumilus piranensis]|uniref:class I SAM-dependent methyltransferase n=1 Tax=Nitrosopumilus piranensis TaxID=1582439 RepID=UPI001F445C22|nr:class I SAM-dependent methyltransferase [Nitrosopumilus piranensis]
MELNCRFCNSSLKHIFADLGKTPLANSYLNSDNLEKPETFYPLKAYVCENCFLVQTDEFEKPQNIFEEYAYHSSFSKTWIHHIQEFVMNTIKRFKLDEKNHVIEIASNDGYMLQFFKNNGIPVLGIEPAKNIAKIAEEKGIPTISKFFGEQTASEVISVKQKADILIAFNVLPHVPNLLDFVKGLKKLLNDNGVLIIQFSAYLSQMIEKTEFDMIYHEHFSYFSLFTLQKIFSHCDLDIFDVEEFTIHGGSLRLFIKHKNNQTISLKTSVSKQLKLEEKFGIPKLITYENYQDHIINIKQNIWTFFKQIKNESKTIVGYGAPAKANTLLNYCGIGTDFLDYTVDLDPYKQGLFLPGTGIPIFSPEKISETNPDYVVILAWNLKDEIIEQLQFIRNWGGKFIVLIPEVEIIS